MVGKCAGMPQSVLVFSSSCSAAMTYVAVIGGFREGRMEDDIDHSRKEMLNGYLHSQLDTLKGLSHHH